MSDGVHNQSRREAQRLANSFIISNQIMAMKVQADWIATGHTGIAPEALTWFGNALHTITDGMSPTHVGYQPWYGTAGITNKLAALDHVRRESIILDSELAANVLASRRFFQETFGDLALTLATIQVGRKDKAIVTVEYTPGDIVVVKR